MSYNDDEEFPSTDQQSSGPKTRAFIAGKTQLTVHNKTKVPLDATKFSVVLELEGYGSKDDTPGVDIVAVLDTSGSMMFDNKLERMKTAMQFLIQKLSPNHRLSVVTFSNNATRLCPLRRMTSEAQNEVGDRVKAIYANGYADISKGLELALQVLDQRRVSERRVSAIILMSPGNQHKKTRNDPTKVKVDNVPVFTFGVGKGAEINSQVLSTIATNSKGGTFSVTDLDSNQESNNLSIALAKCLAGVLTVVVQDLKLTVTKLKPEINIDKLSTKYPTKTVDGDEDSQLISFGDLYSGEKRTVLVHLHLPPATNESGYEVLDIPYSYDYDGEEFEANPVTVSVIRTKGPVDDENEKVASEMTRLGTVDKMQKATDLANKDSFGEAKTELQQALDSLGEAAIKLAIAEILKSQVTQLLVLVQNPDEYRNKGPQVALAILTSHYRQREAATGDDLTIQGLFATPTMTIFVNQAIFYIKDTKKPVPPFTKADVIEPKPKPTNNGNDSGSIMEHISQGIGTAIEAVKTILQSLENIQVLLKSNKIS